MRRTTVGRRSATERTAIIGYSELSLNNPDAAPYYLTAVALMAFGHVLTRRDVFVKA